MLDSMERSDRDHKQIPNTEISLGTRKSMDCETRQLSCKFYKD